MIRGLVTDEEWSFFETFVVSASPLGGRPARDHRRMLDAIFWIARTGAPWRDLPAQLGNWNPVFRQFRRWTASGLWDVMLEALADGGGDADLLAVKLVRDRGVAVAQACRDLEIAESVLRRWMRETEADPRHAFPGHGQVKPEQQEIDRLRREVAKLKAERDILKKAAAYFARDAT